MSTSDSPLLRSGDAPPPRTLLDVFAATVAEQGEEPALDAGTALTYVEVAARAAAVVLSLRAAGVGPRDRVGVRLPSGSNDLYLAILGVLHAGASYVPVDADASDRLQIDPNRVGRPRGDHDAGGVRRAHRRTGSAADEHAGLAVRRPQRPQCCTTSTSAAANRLRSSCRRSASKRVRSASTSFKRLNASSVMVAVAHPTSTSSTA